MQITTNGAPAGADRFDYVEGLVARYPSITGAELDDLKSWFKKEASAYDVASMASKENIHASYKAFRAEHIDNFSVKDYAAAAVATACAVAVIFYFAFMSA